MSTFDEILAQVIDLLQREGRVAYRSLKRRFTLDDEYVEDLKADLIDAKRLARDEDGKVLVWVGEGRKRETAKRETGNSASSQTEQLRDSGLATAERRQLTVLFCDLVGSTALSAQLDPEELREVVRAYQQTCGEVIARYEGHIAQYLGDGLLVYFGYPQAHEDDARRAVRAGLEIIEALHVGARHRRAPTTPGEVPRLQVRLGIHTGLVVIGEMGTSGRTEQLALGETPNVAARIQGLAEPNTLLISAATHRLVANQFEWQPFGSHLLKGLATPITVYHVQGERTEGATSLGHTTPLVGREQEVGLLHERWEQVTEGRGQVILLTGEPGIGKSRLTQTLTEHVTSEGSLALEARCSPYHQHSAFYPLIDAMQRTLFTRDDTAEIKVRKLERALALYDLPDALPLFAALLSLPLPADIPPLSMTPQKQKERTLHALVQWWLTQAARQPTVSVWEDLHCADPSTLEFLTLLLEQVPTSRLLILLTARPEFVSPWPPRSHFVTLTLNRLGHRQTAAMITEVAGAAALPADVLQQILAKTDGVPLFVEELTKSVLETLREQGPGAGQQGTGGVFAIPATLQDSLMARLDRLNTAKELAQLGATLGREFSYDLLQAISPLSEDALQQGLRQLVESELIYQRGIPPQSTYTFKHALIQDTAYHSLLKSRRQQLHQQIAQVLEERFPDTKTTQPELLAHHYTEANLLEQAIPYWQQAGERATQRSANQEAISHLTKGIEVLKQLPTTPTRIQRELMLQLALGVPFMATKGWSAPEVGQTFSRAHELSQQVEETPLLFPVLFGLAAFYAQRAEYQTAQDLLERCLRLADSTQDPTFMLMADYLASGLAAHQGNFAKSQKYYGHGLALYDRTEHGSLAFRFGLDPGAGNSFYAILTSWYCGYPDQALKKAQDGWVLAQNLTHPASQVWAGSLLPWVHLLRREAALTEEQAEVIIRLAAEKEQIQPLAFGTICKGYALATQGHAEEGLTVMQQGLATLHATGARVFNSLLLVWQAQIYGWLGRTEEGLTILKKAQEFIEETGERIGEAELYRLKGELLLQQAREQATGNGDE